MATRWFEFFGEHLPASMTYPDLAGVSGQVANWLFLALFAVALAAVLPECLRACTELLRGACGRGVPAERATPARLARLGAFVLTPLVLYLPLTALAYGLSDLRMGGYVPYLVDGGYRYYLPTLTFACLLIAVVAARWLEHPRLRPAGALLVAGALLSGGFDLALIDPSLERAGRGSHYEGHYMKQVARGLVAPKHGFEDAEIVRFADPFPPVYRSRIYEGLGFYRALIGSMQAPLESLEPAQLSNPWPLERRADVLRGVGSSLRKGLLDPARRGPVLDLLSRLALQSPELADEVAAGMALEWDVVLASGTQSDSNSTIAALGVLPARLRPALARGLGIAVGRLLRRRIASEAEWIATLPENLPDGCASAYLDGLGLGLADGARDAGWPAGLDFEAAAGAQVLAALDARLSNLHGAEVAAQRARLAGELPPDLLDLWEAQLRASEQD